MRLVENRNAPVRVTSPHETIGEGVVEQRLLVLVLALGQGREQAQAEGGQQGEHGDFPPHPLSREATESSASFGVVLQDKIPH